MRHLFSQSNSHRQSSNYSNVISTISKVSDSLVQSIKTPEEYKKEHSKQINDLFSYMHPNFSNGTDNLWLQLRDHVFNYLRYLCSLAPYTDFDIDYRNQSIIVQGLRENIEFFVNPEIVPYLLNDCTATDIQILFSPLRNLVTQGPESVHVANKINTILTYHKLRDLGSYETFRMLGIRSYYGTATCLPKGFTEQKHFNNLGKMLHVKFLFDHFEEIRKYFDNLITRFESTKVNKSRILQSTITLSIGEHNEHGDDYSCLLHELLIWSTMALQEDFGILSTEITRGLLSILTKLGATIDSSEHNDTDYIIATCIDLYKKLGDPSKKSDIYSEELCDYMLES